MELLNKALYDHFSLELTSKGSTTASLNSRICVALPPSSNRLHTAAVGWGPWTSKSRQKESVPHCTLHIHIHIPWRVGDCNPPHRWREGRFATPKSTKSAILDTKRGSTNCRDATCMFGTGRGRPPGCVCLQFKIVSGAFSGGD